MAATRRHFLWELHLCTTFQHSSAASWSCLDVKPRGNGLEPQIHFAWYLCTARSPLAVSPQASSNAPSCSCFSSKSHPGPSVNSCVKTGPVGRHSERKEPEQRVSLTHSKKSKGASGLSRQGRRSGHRRCRQSNRQGTGRVRSITDCDKDFRFYPEWEDTSLKSFDKGGEMLYLMLKENHSGSKKKSRLRKRKKRHPPGAHGRNPGVRWGWSEWGEVVRNALQRGKVMHAPTGLKGEKERDQSRVG